MRFFTATNEATGEKRDIKIRPLTRREIKDMKDLGYSYFGCVPERENSEEVVDKGLERVLSRDDLAFLDECSGRDTRDAWKAMLKETYGAEEEEKNSGNTSDGTQTVSE